MWYMCQPDQCRGLYLHSLLAAAIARTRFFCVAAFPPRTSRPSVFSPLHSSIFFSSPPLRPSSALFLPPFQSKRTVLLCVCPYLRKRYGKERRVFLVVKACRYAGLVALQMRQNFFLFLLFMRVVLGTSTPDVHAVDVFILLLCTKVGRRATGQGLGDVLACIMYSFSVHRFRSLE